MKRKIIISISILLFCLILLLSCAPPKLKPSVSPTTENFSTPHGFTTYTSEGLFSISYPNEWSPAMSILAELEEITIDYLKSIDPEIEAGDFQLLFFAGEPYREGYYPSVSIATSPRGIGYYTLSEICDAEDIFSREYSQRYRVYSQIRSTVNGREVDIKIDEDYTVEDGEWRYMTLTTVKGKFVWFVTCSSESKDFSNYEDTFNKIVRSFRILN